MPYNHGARSKQSTGGVRAIKSVDTSLIVVLGTAAAANADKYPLDTPVLINAGNNSDYAKLGATGTLPKAVDAIRDQIGATVVVIRIDNGGTDAQQLTRAVDKVQLIRGVEAITGQKPKILICPHYATATVTGGVGNEVVNPVVAELLSIAGGLRAMVLVDGTNTTTAEAIVARNFYGDKRLIIVDPLVKVWDNISNAYINDSTVSRVAGLFAKNDAELSAFHTPSNLIVKGIGGTTRPIQYATSDTNSEHNLLNRAQIGCIVNNGGFRYLGTDTTDTTDSFNRFINAVRAGDAIDDALEASLQWAIDRNITKTFIDDVSASVQGYLDDRIAAGELLPGSKCVADPELNTTNAYAQGQVYFSFEYLVPSPAVDIVITRQVNYDLSKGIFN